MKKIFTSLTILCVLLVGATQAVLAQLQPTTSQNIRNNLGNPRFLVNTPSNIAGLKTITLATWGGQLPLPLINAPVARGLDSLALSPLTNGSAVSGKVCLLFRGGGVTFAQKAQYAVAAGAIGVIIVNNVPGDPAGMSNTGTVTYTVPIVMVSDVDGIAMNNALRASVPVNVSIGGWGLGAAHDLAILPAYQSVPHALNIPYSQLSVGASRQPYKNFVAGAVVNYGTSSETNINVLDSVVWTPTGGASSTVHQSSYNVAAITPLDSVRFGFGNASSSYSLPAPTSTGTYTYNYRMTYPNTDQYPQDNIYSYKEYVTDSIFCKGAYDYTRNAPHVTLGIQPASGTAPFSMGPLYYVADGKYAARKIQYTVSMNGATTLAGSETFALLYKWVDSNVNITQPKDSFIQANELKLVGVTYKAFSTADTSGAVITLAVKDAVSPTKTVVLDSNAWYWTAAQATLDAFVGVDESTSFFTRAYEQSQVFNYQEHPEILFTRDYTELATATGAVATFPFGGNAYYVDSTFYDRFYFIPAVALHISKAKVGTVTPGSVGEQSREIGDVKVYPVPAKDFINVDARLNKKYSSVGYRLLDIGGRVVYKLDKANIQNDKISIPTVGIASGIYHLILIADGDLTTRQVVISR